MEQLCGSKGWGLGKVLLCCLDRDNAVISTWAVRTGEKVKSASCWSWERMWCSHIKRRWGEFHGSLWIWFAFHFSLSVFPSQQSNNDILSNIDVDCSQPTVTPSGPEATTTPSGHTNAQQPHHRPAATPPGWPLYFLLWSFVHSQGLREWYTQRGRKREGERDGERETERERD